LASRQQLLCLSLLEQQVTASQYPDYQQLVLELYPVHSLHLYLQLEPQLLLT
jgi:hypothetical protein